MSVYLRALAQQMCPDDTQPYAWLIDTDHLAEPGEDSDVGTAGPSDAPDELLALLTTTKRGIKFRMRDGDDELYYSGRILLLDEQGKVVESFTGEQELFGPLEDFGVGNAGCTSIQYFTDGSWTEL